MTSSLRHSWPALLWCICSSSAPAQSYPVKPIQIIVPFGVGVSSDVVYRTLAPYLSERLGQQVLIVNRPGGTATIGMNVVAKSAPDGYTLGVATLSFSANPTFMAGRMPFDTEKDLAPVSQILRLPLVLTVNPSVPARSIAELIALARAKPGSLNYGSAGVGSSGHLVGALFESVSAAPMTHVPYSGTDIVTGLVAGQTQVAFTPFASARSFIVSGRLVPLGVTTLKPDPAFPDIPAIADSGVPGYEAYEWSGLMARAGTPDATIGRLHQEIVKTLATPEANRRLVDLGAQPVGSTPEEFAALIKKELRTWARVAADIKAVSSR